MYHGDCGGKFNKVKRFSNSGVTATDYSHWLLSEEGGIAGSTVGHPLTGEFIFPEHAQFLVVGATGHNYCPGCKVAFSSADNFMFSLNGNAGSLGENGFKSVPGCLLVHQFSEIEASDSFRKPGEVVYALGVCYLATNHALLDKQAIESSP